MAIPSHYPDLGRRGAVGGDVVRRIVNEPQAGIFKLRLVKGGPWVAAMIRHLTTGWHASINGHRYASVADPTESPEIMRIWHYGHEINSSEYLQLMRPGRTVDASRPVNLLTQESPF